MSPLFGEKNLEYWGASFKGNGFVVIDVDGHETLVVHEQAGTRIQDFIKKTEEEAGEEPLHFHVGIVHGFCPPGKLFKIDNGFLSEIDSDYEFLHTPAVEGIDSEIIKAIYREKENNLW